MMRAGERTVRSSALRTQQEILLHAAEEIGLFVETPIRVLGLASHVVGEVWSDPWKAQTVLIQVCLEAPILERVYLLDAEGREIASSDMKPVPMPPEGRQVFEEVMWTRSLYRSGASIQEEVPSIMLGLPVFHHGRAVGALVALVDLRGMWELGDRIRMGKHDVAYVVSEEGVFLAHTDKRAVLRGGRLPDEEWAMMRSDPGGRIELRDETGGGLVSHARVPELGWRVALRQSREEAYRSSALMRRALLLTLTAATILAVAIVALAVRAML